MAAITATRRTTTRIGGGLILGDYGTGSANQADTLTSTAVPKGGSQRLLRVTCNYSAAPTQAGVTIEIDGDNGIDSLLFTFPANTQKNFFEPEHGDAWLFPGDAIRVSAPAGGGGITAAIEIVLEGQ